MDINLFHATMNVDGDDYTIDLMFGSNFINAKGERIGKQKSVSMRFCRGMEPEHFVQGLRLMADHVEKEIVNSDDFKR